MYLKIGDKIIVYNGYITCYGKIKEISEDIFTINLEKEIKSPVIGNYKTLLVVKEYVKLSITLCA